MGAGVDGHEEGDTGRIFTPPILGAMKSSGLGALSYRLRTELGIEAWHWNPRGHWSEPAKTQGYWVSDADSTAPITVSYGYRLPRRGSTVDQAGDEGYSRIDDGDDASFWKTNPYLDPHYTHEPEALHPQWVVVDLGTAANIGAARVKWGTPYPISYHFDYWKGTPDPGENEDGAWFSFPGGKVGGGKGGNVLLSLAAKPVKTRYVRLWLMKSSHTAPTGSKDARDSLGFALRELGLGTVDQSGRFQDAVHHAKENQGQTKMIASSCDSWHRASDLDPRTEQPGLDLIASSGLSRGLPLLLPAAVLYDNPDNVRNELLFLKARSIKLRGLELGEEPDGQCAAPSDFAALYRQMAAGLRAIDPQLPLGGPSFQSVDVDFLAWPEPPQTTNWLGKFLGDMKAHGAADQFNFCTFEWYPMDDVTVPPTPLLRGLHGTLDEALRRFREAGLPASIPLLISEYGYSAFGSRTEVDLPGMIFNADSVAYFLQRGGETAYLYGYEPGSLLNEMVPPQSNSPLAWGNNMLFLADDDGDIAYRLPTFYGAQLMTTQWAQPRGSAQPIRGMQPGNGLHQMYLTTCAAPAKSSGIHPNDLCAYTVHRPDGRWACLLLNKNPARTVTVSVGFAGGAAHPGATLGGLIDLYQYSGRQYIWHAAGANGHPLRDLPPEHLTFANPPPTYTLPPNSLTVVRGR